MRFVQKLGSVGAALLVVAGCGPSLTTVHEGTVRFEHCYRVDLEPKVPAEQRKSCWQGWVTAYTLGQPRDRIEYAEQRLRALDAGDSSCPSLALDGNHHAELRQFYLVVPAPSSAHATPPPIATVVQTADSAAAVDGGAPASERAKTGEPKQPPAASCAEGCQASWQSCDASCSPTGSSACTKCKTAYSKCMRGCFQ